MKRRIKLTEGDLRRIVDRSVRRVLDEGLFDFFKRGGGNQQTSSNEQDILADMQQRFGVTITTYMPKDQRNGNAYFYCKTYNPKTRQQLIFYIPTSQNGKLYSMEEYLKRLGFDSLDTSYAYVDEKRKKPQQQQRWGDFRHSPDFTETSWVNRM